MIHSFFLTEQRQRRNNPSGEAKKKGQGCLHATHPVLQCIVVPSMAFKPFLNAFLTRHFHKLTAAALTGSCYLCWHIVQKRVEERNVRAYDTVATREMSEQEALVRAMVQNALESTPQENLQNAVEANTRFMLPGQPAPRPAFLDKVEANGKQIRKDHAEQRQRQKEEEQCADKFTPYRPSSESS